MSVWILPVPGVPEITAGDDLGAVIAEAVGAGGLALEPGDILVVASKIVAKSLGLRRHTSRDAAIAAETVRVVAERTTAERVTRVVEAAAGPVMAAAGVDESNLGPDGGVLVLPRDPDAAARAVLDSLRRALDWPKDRPLGVIVSDTAGRPWRAGVVDFALGSAGVVALHDHRGDTDTDGRPLVVTTIAVADEIAAAADLVKGKISHQPVAVVRGLPWATTDPGMSSASDLVRTGPGDWFHTGPVEAVRAALGVVPGSADATEIGIRSVGPEEAGDRAARAVRVALHAVAGVVATADWPQVELHADDEFALGRALARLEVACASEDLTVESVDRTGSRLTVTLADR